MATEAVVTTIPNRKGRYLAVIRGTKVEVLARFVNAEAEEQFRKEFTFRGA